MARKKKITEEFTVAGIRDNLVSISLKTHVPLETLRELNPDIKNIIFKIPAGRKVRIA